MSVHEKIAEARIKAVYVMAMTKAESISYKYANMIVLRADAALAMEDNQKTWEYFIGCKG